MKKLLFMTVSRLDYRYSSKNPGDNAQPVTIIDYLLENFILFLLLLDRVTVCFFSSIVYDF